MAGRGAASPLREQRVHEEQQQYTIVVQGAWTRANSESRSGDAFRNAVLHSDLSVADGMPLVWLARLIGIPVRERVAH